MPKFKSIPPELRVNKKIAQKVVKLMQYGIPIGTGTPEKGKMCIEHIISYVYGIPNNFHPKCVGKKVNQSKIDLNDCNWSSNKVRAEGMAKIGIAQLGSVNIDQDEYEKELQIELNKIILPFLMENQKDKDEFILKQIERFKLATTDEEREKIRVENFNNYNYNYRNYSNNYNYTTTTLQQLLQQQLRRQISKASI
jgi:hypothetical protein